VRVIAVIRLVHFEGLFGPRIEGRRAIKKKRLPIMSVASCHEISVIFKY
jgi:hypothetical protein